MDHSKGKSVNTSVPTIAVRFNATAEEIEEVYQSEDEPSELTKSEQTKSTGDLEGSPLRYLPRLGKKSASTENSLTSHDSSPTTDPWKFFAGIKGKITKNIEDTITEIKHRNQDGDSSSAKKVKETKDNHSDSEDISESSISKTCGAASTTEGVEMSTDEDTSSFEKDKKLDDNHQQSEENLDSKSEASSVLRRRVKIITKGKNDKDSGESLVSVSTLGKLIELDTGINPANTPQSLKESVDVESGIEALEDFSAGNEVSLQGDQDNNDLLPEELLTAVTKNIDNLELEEEKNAIVIKPVTGSEIRQSFIRDQKPRSYFAPVGFVDLRMKRLFKRNWYNFVYSFKRFLGVVCFIIVYIYIPIPVYYRGLIDGAIIAVALMALYYLINGIGSGDQPLVCQSETMVTLPEIKEHIPINSYEGWMNEYPESYNPVTYNVSQTQSVYIRLQGNLLRISHTRLKIPKRAMWNEPKHKHVFTQHRIYNLLGAKIVLLPDGLHKKRQWSKKYPICIILHSDQHNFEQDDNMSMSSRTCCESETKRSLSNGKKSSIKKKHKKKVIVQPQLFSKLSEEILDIDSETDNPEDVTNLHADELNVSGKNLSENSHDEDDYGSHIIPEDEQQEDDVISVDDWSTFTPTDSPVETHIYLFGRTGREKEDWFRRFSTAMHKGPDSLTQTFQKLQHEETISETLIKQTDANTKYLQYMSQYTKVAKVKDVPVQESEYFQTLNVLWLNAVIGRIIYDWSKDTGFSNALKERIQKKLMSIKLPYFIEQLNVFELSLGDTSPLINHTGKPILDQRGLWVDLDISYNGTIVLTLQTKLNLMKLKDSHNPNDNCLLGQQPANKWQNSDVEDSAESSTDDDRISPPPKIADQSRVSPLGNTATKSKKLMKMVDRITESKFFQAATDNRYIKRAMEEVSNTDLSLKVELKGLIGTLAINIPPPPSDRIWIGFRPTPKMYLSAQPIVGVRNMSFIRYLTNWIEKKLCKEFQKVMVIPNMEDFMIPNMSSELPK